MPSVSARGILLLRCALAPMNEIGDVAMGNETHTATKNHRWPAAFQSLPNLHAGGIETYRRVTRRRFPVVMTRQKKEAQMRKGRGPQPKMKGPRRERASSVVVAPVSHGWR